MSVKKKRKNLARKLLVSGVIIKLSFLSPSGTRIPDNNYNNDLQQNLNKTEHIENYGKEDDFPTNNYDYYSFTKSL